MKVFTLLHVVSKWLELQKPDWTHSEDFLMKINFLFEKQGRIHGYPSCVRLGRSSAGEGH